jgi:Xaa-Pro aminopeptidase
MGEYTTRSRRAKARLGVAKAARLQVEKAARLIVAASDTDADLLWATRLFAPDPFIFIQKGRRRYLVMSDLEVDRAKDQSSVDRVLHQSDYVRRIQSRGESFPTSAHVVGAVFEDLGIRSALVPANFPLGLADQLRASGLRIQVQPPPFWPQREIKREDEVKAIRASLKAAETGMEAGIAALSRSRISRGFLKLDGSRLTSERLRSIINSTIMRLGYVPSHTIVASGEQGVDPHNEGSGPIRAHSPVIMDIFPRSQTTGYFGDMTRTVVRGTASDTLKRAYAAVREAQNIGFRRIRPRASAYDIHTEILDYFQSQGFETGRRNGRMQGFFHGTGHGLGLDIHEAPGFGLRARNRFRKNHVVTVEPGLYYPGMGGIRLEDVVVVTDKGCRNLVRFPKFLEI